MKHVLALVIAALIVFPCRGFTQDNYVVFAVGDNSTLLYRVDLMEWAAVPVDSIPGCGDLLSVWGSSDQDIYVAGCDDDLLHFDGTQWHKIAMANPYVDITAVSGTGPDNIYAGGFVPGESPSGTSYHFDGAVWSEITGGGIIQKVWADSGGGFYSFGLFYDPVDRYYYQRVKSYRNGTWNSESLMIGSANPDYFEDEYYGIYGCLSDRPIVTGYWEHLGVGGGGAIHYKENSTWDCMREPYPCGIWSMCPVLPTVWHAVYCVSEDEIWFAGENGKIMRWTPPWGKQEYDLQIPITFRAIWVGPGNKVYAAGDYGYIVHYYNSSFWLVMNTYTTENLNGIWGYYIEEPVATQTPEIQLTLLPNYPNPFNPTTTITYSVPTHCRVTIHIFDVAGNFVRTILSAEQPPGRYTIHWNGLNDRGHEVASGTYFCCLTAGKQSLSRKMLLMR